MTDPRFQAVLDYFKVGEQDWTVRRRMAIAMQAIGTWMIFYGGTREASSAMGMQLVSSGVTLLLGVLSGYIAGAIVDSHLKRKSANGNGDHHEEGEAGR